MGGGLFSEKSPFTGDGDRLGAPIRAEFPVQIVDMRFDRADSDHQFLSDLLIGFTDGDQPENFQFALA